MLKAENKEIINWIEDLIKYVFIDKLGEEGNKILEILKRGEMSDMEDLLERIEINEAKIRKNLINRGFRKGVSEGRTLGISEGRTLGMAEGRTLGMAEGKTLGMAEGRTLGISEGKSLGILETVANVIKNMLQQNEDEEKIMRYTNAKKEDIERVKKELKL